MDLPYVIQCETLSDGDSRVVKASLLLDITADLSAFSGHFKNKPILPGVVQIQWAIDFASQQFGDVSARDISQIDVLKFQNIVQPGNKITLEIEKVKNKITFAYHTAGVQHSSGKIVIN